MKRARTVRGVPLAATCGTGTPSPEAAVASGRYHDVFVDTAGKRTEARGIGTWVWSRRGGRWQIIHQHATPDAAASGQ